MASVRVCLRCPGCQHPEAWRSLKTWRVGEGGDCEVQSACWSVSGRGCWSPGRFWERLQNMRGRSDFDMRQISALRSRVSGTHSPSSPASALLTSCGCSSCRRGLTACSAPVGARPYTNSDPPSEVCAEQKCCCSRHRPSSSASLHGSYSDQALQRTTNLGDADAHMFKNT